MWASVEPRLLQPARSGFAGEIEPRNDGLRILVARFRGRGMPSTRYHVWMANLGPSEKLLRDFQSGAIGWGQFSRGYRLELLESGDLDRRNPTIKNHGQKFTLRLLQELVAHCGPERRLVVARELTKRFEEVVRGTTATMLETFQGRAIRGEFTLVLAGRPA